MYRQFPNVPTNSEKALLPPPPPPPPLGYASAVATTRVIGGKIVILS